MIADLESQVDAVMGKSEAKLAAELRETLHKVSATLVGRTPQWLDSPSRAQAAFPDRC